MTTAASLAAGTPLAVLFAACEAANAAAERHLREVVDLPAQAHATADERMKDTTDNNALNDAWVSAMYAIGHHPAATMDDLQAKLAFMVANTMGDGQDWLPTIEEDVKRVAAGDDATAGIVPSELSAEACRACRFWKVDPSSSSAPEGIALEEGDIAFGHCRRNAPSVAGELAALCIPRPVWGRDDNPGAEEIWTTQLYRASTFPVSESADWCGKFEATKGAR